MSRVKLPVLLAYLVGALGVGRASAWDLGWIDQIGLSGTDTGIDVTTDATGVYATGTVTGALPGQVDLGSRDLYLRKYAFDGTVLWTRQFGTPAFDFNRGVVAHGGAVFVAGFTNGAFPGYVNAGSSDVFVRKYTPDGDVVWTVQFGTDLFDGGFGMAVNETGVYVAGDTLGTFPGQPPGEGTDTFVARVDPSDGTVLWIDQVGFRSPYLFNEGGVAVDGSGVYVATIAAASTPFRKYDFDGNEVWARDLLDLGTCFFGAFSVSAYGGRVYLLGQAREGFLRDPSTCDESDPFFAGGLRAYTADGDLAWRRVIAAGPRAGEDPITGAKVVVPSASGVYVAANTTTTFAGHTVRHPRPDYSECAGLGDPAFADKLDAYVRRYDADGNVIWTHQFGTGVFDLVFGIAFGPDALYVTGDTSCGLLGQTYGGGLRDAFVMKIAIDSTSASGHVHRIVGTVETLRDAGRLSPAAFHGLIMPLTGALRAIEEGQPQRARRQLEAFISVVERYRERGILTPLEVDDLSDAARAVIAEL